VEVGRLPLVLCRQKEYKDADLLAGLLGVDISLLPAPPCIDCDHYEECCKVDDLIRERENLCCVGVDEDAVSSAITAALAALDEEERRKLLEYGAWAVV